MEFGGEVGELGLLDSAGEGDGEREGEHEGVDREGEREGLDRDGPADENGPEAVADEADPADVEEAGLDVVHDLVDQLPGHVLEALEGVHLDECPQVVMETKDHLVDL